MRDARNLIRLSVVRVDNCRGNRDCTLGRLWNTAVGMEKIRRAYVNSIVRYRERHRIAIHVDRERLNRMNSRCHCHQQRNNDDNSYSFHK